MDTGSSNGSIAMRRIDTEVFRLALITASVLLVSCQTAPKPVGAVSEDSDTAPTFEPSAYVVEVSDAEGLVQLGMQHHPGIRAGEAKVRRLAAKVDQVTALPDPKAKISAGNMAETAAGRVDFMAGVEQVIPFPGKLREQGQIAGREAAVALADLEALRLQVAERIRQAYWSYFLAVKTTEINRQSRSVLELVRNTIDTRVAANQASQGDQLKLSTELGNIDKVLVQSRQREQSSKASLNALLNRQAGASLPVPSNVASPQTRELNALLAKAETVHPDVASSRAQIQSLQHRLKAAELDRYPNFVLGLQHALVSDSGLAPSANGRDQVFASIGINIPLWQKPRRAKIREAAASIDEAQSQLAAVRADLRFRVEDAWLRLQSSRELIALFDQRILPESKQAFNVSIQSYAADRLTFLEVLDTWRQWLGYQLQQTQNHASLGQATAALRSASGEL